MSAWPASAPGTRTPERCGTIGRMEADQLLAALDPEAAKFVESVNGGNQTVPTLLFADGSTLCNPSAAQVQKKLAALAATSAS